MSNVENLREQWEKAEAKAHEIQAKRDEALQKVRDQYDQRLRDQVDKAAAAQKAFLDAEVRESLKDRPDGEAVAEALGIDLEG